MKSDIRKKPLKKADGPMSADSFYKWRKTLGLKQKEAAELLGLQKRMIQYYEKGSRDGKPVAIPKSVRLACYALEQGIEDFDGATTSPLDITRFIAESAPDRP